MCAKAQNVKNDRKMQLELLTDFENWQPVNWAACCAVSLIKTSANSCNIAHKRVFIVKYKILGIWWEKLIYYCCNLQLTLQF